MWEIFVGKFVIDFGEITEIFEKTLNSFMKIVSGFWEKWRENSEKFSEYNFLKIWKKYLNFGKILYVWKILFNCMEISVRFGIVFLLAIMNFSKYFKEILWKFWENWKYFAEISNRFLSNYEEFVEKDSKLYTNFAELF